MTLWLDGNRGRRWLLLAGVLLALAAPLLSGTARQAAYVAVAATALVAVRNGLRRYPRSRRLAWWLLGAAMLCCVVANTIWGAGMAAGLAVPDQLTAVDIVYLGMYPLLAAGLLAMPVGRRPLGWRGLTEAGVMLCTGTVLAWTLLYNPFVDDGGPWPGAVSVLAYPMLDLLILAAATRMVAVRRTLTWPDRALLAAVSVLTVADVGYFVSTASGGDWAGPGWSASGWLLAFLLIAAAAWHPESAGNLRPDRRAHGRSRLSLAGDVVLVLVGPAAVVWLKLTEQQPARLDLVDLILPLTTTACTALLLVLRLIHAGGLAGRRAADLRAAQREMSHRSRHDALTGLPNRVRLEECLAGTPSGALITLDLDGFKDVNERFGHPTGDTLLTVAAIRLRDLTPAGGIAARLGGDEFALLLPDTGTTEATARAELLVAAFRVPVPADGHTLHVTASAGVRVFDRTADPVQVLSDADLALYAAKAAGKDQAALYDVAFRVEQADRLRLLERLRASVEAGEFAVHYQPIVALDDSRPVAVEALVRWTPPGRAPISPDRFIPAAEDSGLIVALGEWVLRKACTDAVVWHRRWGTTLTVNVSPRQLVDPHFTTKALAALKDSGLPPGALTLEITEGVLVRAGVDAHQALLHLSALRSEGVRVAIDDFGTGYSSLAYLRDLPIDVLKIDRSFMPADDTDTQQAALVRAIVDLAAGLGLTTVAEGVETAHHADLLRDLGCERGQGYHFARPIPAPHLTDLLAETDPAQPDRNTEGRIHS
ncbi:MAG TPA: bifunctional diguanylate cyclase/phosphodiesterase [Actinoplanes sp.]|nr:bifunctional diguanylate cyclase/phosphodiesterase [Actinoplanes sp.]